MNKTIYEIIGMVIFLILLVLPIVQASTHSEIREKGQELGTIENIDNYLQETNIYRFHNYKKGLNRYWQDRIGDCTEIARVKYLMYKSIGFKARISHCCIMIPKVSKTNRIYGYKCDKHDYVEYYNNSWQTTEQDYFTNQLERKGRGIW